MKAVWNVELKPYTFHSSSLQDAVSQLSRYRKLYCAEFCVF